MHKLPNSLRKVGSNTVKAGSQWSDAAILSHFQSQQGTPELVRTTCSARHLPGNELQPIKLRSVADDFDFDDRSFKPVLTGSRFLQDIIQEVIRPVCRSMKTCVDRACSISFRRNTTRSKQPAYPWMTYEYGRSRTGISIAPEQIVHRKSSHFATDREYMFRRVKRQRVFHEKGNVS